MAIVEHLIASCNLDGFSAVYAIVNDVTEKLLRIEVRGRSRRLVDIRVTEPILTERKHDHVIGKKAGNVVFDMGSHNIPWVDDDDDESPVGSIKPSISVTWHDLERR